MKTSAIHHLFQRFAKMHVVVVGDSMVDAYMWGNVERISPEAPIPIVSINRRDNRLGGAANVSLNIQALGATPHLFTLSGNDNKGRKFKKLLEKHGIGSAGVFTDPNRKTTVKSRIISQGQHIARVDEESTHPVDAALENQLVEAISGCLQQTAVDVIIFVDYDKGVITPTLFEKVNQLATQRGIPTAVDPKKRNFKHYREVTLFKPNFNELVNGLGFPIAKGDFNTLREKSGALKKERNFQLIFITLSELGVFISNGKNEQHFPAIVRPVADVSGAGDTVISVASLALAAGMAPEIMAGMANLAGGLVCEKTGVVPIDSKQLMEEMLRHRHGLNN